MQPSKQFTTDLESLADNSIILFFFHKKDCWQITRHLYLSLKSGFFKYKRRVDVWEREALKSIYGYNKDNSCRRKYIYPRRWILSSVYSNALDLKLKNKNTLKF